ncbi:hypothetical protein NDU88_001529 [Pleurodeles waltl]|uniref:Secreted protein n=1 Tax=Pleurodeles waltl TaxID=8319 RepID=A0AAV7MLS7_PLEWA|nr:hypothetical protein NDU88_001529 [Pleurodeles waltl]
MAALTLPLSVAFTATAMAAADALVRVYSGALVSASAPSRSLRLTQCIPSHSVRPLEYVSCCCGCAFFPSGPLSEQHPD